MLAEKRSSGRGSFYASGRHVAANFAPGPEAETDGRATGWGPSLRLSPATSRLALGQRRRGALLDGGFCTPLAADFAPGPKVGAGARYWMGLLCAFHRHLWAWPGGGTLLHEGFSSPFATDFSRPGREVQVGGALIEGGFSAPFGADFGSPWDWRGDRT